MSSLDKAQFVKAVVQKVFSKGNHGPYAVATAQGIDGSITFSLGEGVWSEADWPEPGEYVLLNKFRKKRAGWRAMKARFYKPMDEQRANSKEHIMKTMKTLIKRWKEKFFSEESERVWEEWVDFDKRDWKDLKDLVQDGGVRPEFKARALFIMLTPELSWCPFYWVDHEAFFDRYKGYPGLGFSFNLSGLSAELLCYVADLIKVFYQSVKNRRSEDFVGTMSIYNNYVINLLARLPEEWAEDLFPIFEINDPTVWCNIDAASGYNPLERLFAHPKVNERWKREADAKIRQVILDEICGRSEPRADHEEALKRYADMIQLQMYKNRMTYSQAFFVDQIRFIANLSPAKRDRPLIDSWKITAILKMIATEYDDDLLYRFSRFILADGGGKFVAHNQSTIEAAKLMLIALKDDLEAVDILQDAIFSGRQIVAEKERRRQEKEWTEQAIMKKMKRSVEV